MDDVLQDHEEAVLGEVPHDTSEAATTSGEPAVTVVDSPGWQPPSGYAQAPPPQQQQQPPPPPQPVPPPAQQPPWYAQPGYYGAPQPGYPMPPGPPVMPPVQNGGDGRHSRGLLIGGLGALVLLILGAGVAIVVAISGSHPVIVAKPAAQTLSTSTSNAPTAPAQTTRTVTKTASAPPPPASNPTAGSATQIEAMLTSHFQDLVDGNYAASFADLTGAAAGSAGSESEWISAQRTDGLYSFSLTVVPQVTSATTATAQITHFITRASGSGCKTWTGDWSLVNEHGQWLITEANLNGSLSSCNA